MNSARRVVATLGGVKIVKAATWEDLQTRRRAGLPYASVDAISSAYHIGSRDLVRILELPLRTLARRKKEKRLHADESDRLLRLGRVAALAEEMLGSREKASEWLHEPNAALGHETPLRHLDSDLGARQVEDVLVRIAHGVYS
ncbi:MAG TPA: antitoxin Xre/MbcA/ParS toxin-binding domain-containing protein [Thermoanaerobaculia bacterium]|nr:antitoxin Xre/MbcA/ParS toxin-binding domain-containing protein [Thermoanaerobaculia bacterium]